MLVNAEQHAHRKHEAKKRCSTRREEGQGNADYGKNRYAHSDIYYRLSEYHCKNTHSNVHSPIIAAKLAYMKRPEANCDKQNYYGKAAEKAKLLADADKDKVVITLGHGA